MKFKIVRLTPIPIALIIISLIGIFLVYSKSGDLFLKDIDLKGGTSLTLIFNESLPIEKIEPIIKQKLDSFIISSSKTIEGYTSIKILSEKNVDASEIIAFLNSNGIYPIEHSLEFVGPELGNVFFSQVSLLLTVAYFLLFLITLYIYKRFIISITIIFSSLMNILAVFGIMNLLNQKISFAGFSSLLMLIAFTIDSNVLLATKVFSAKAEEFYEQYKKGLITCLTTDLGLIISMMIVLILTNSPFLINIAQIQIIGFISDILNTWILNAAMLEVIMLGKRH